MAIESHPEGSFNKIAKLLNGAEPSRLVTMSVCNETLQIEVVGSRRIQKRTIQIDAVKLTNYIKNQTSDLNSKKTEKIYMYFAELFENNDTIFHQHITEEKKKALLTELKTYCKMPNLSNNTEMVCTDNENATTIYTELRDYVGVVLLGFQNYPPDAAEKILKIFGKECTPDNIKLITSNDGKVLPGSLSKYLGSIGFCTSKTSIDKINGLYTYFKYLYFDPSIKKGWEGITSVFIWNGLCNWKKFIDQHSK